MNKIKATEAGLYEKWLAAQIMQCVLRTGSYPLKTSDRNLVQRIIEEIRRKWGITCCIDYDKSELLPTYSYTISLVNARLPLGKEQLIHLLEILNDLLLKGYCVIRDINDSKVQEDVRLCKEYFQFDCSVKLNEEVNDTTTYVIIRS